MKKKIYVKPTFKVTTVMMECSIASSSVTSPLVYDRQLPSGWEDVDPTVSNITF